MKDWVFPCLNWKAIISLASVLTLSGQCQQGNQAARNRPETCLNSVEDASIIATHYRAIGTIDDRGTHRRWILLRNRGCPTSPAVLVQEPSSRSCERAGEEISELRCASDMRSFSLPVIHAGDYLIVSEHTRTFDAALEATALKPAAIGDRLTVRLKFGGHTLSVIATGPGRASLSEEESAARR